jgi:hypothetical protein
MLVAVELFHGLDCQDEIVLVHGLKTPDLCQVVAGRNASLGDCGDNEAVLEQVHTVRTVCMEHGGLGSAQYRQALAPRQAPEYTYSIPQSRITSVRGIANCTHNDAVPDARKCGG